MLDCINVGGECGIEEGLEYETRAVRPDVLDRGHARRHRGVPRTPQAGVHRPLMPACLSRCAVARRCATATRAHCASSRRLRDDDLDRAIERRAARRRIACASCDADCTHALLAGARRTPSPPSPRANAIARAARLQRRARRNAQRDADRAAPRSQRRRSAGVARRRRGRPRAREGARSAATGRRMASREERADQAPARSSKLPPRRDRGTVRAPARTQSATDHRTRIHHAVRTAGRGDPVGAGHRRRRQQGHAQAVPGRQHARGDRSRWARTA